MLFVIDFVNIKIKPAQSLKVTHINRVYVCVFTGVGAHTYISIYICTIFLEKKKDSIRRQAPRLQVQSIRWLRASFRGKVPVLLLPTQQQDDIILCLSDAKICIEEAIPLVINFMGSWRFRSCVLKSIVEIFYYRVQILWNSCA
jgi:hypothetical protein